MDLFITFDGDRIGNRVGRARLDDNVDEVRRLDQLITMGNKIFTDWAVNVGGSVVEAAGDEGLVQVPASKIGDLDKLREQYAKLVGATMSVGIGIKISESSKALLVAKLRGRDRIVFYTPELDEEIAKAKESDQKDQAKIIDEYLSKGDMGENHGDHAGFSAPQSPMQPQKDTQSPDPIDFEPQLHNFAQQQAIKDQANTVDTGMRRDQIKQDVVQILQTIKQQAPVIGQLKAQAPEVYESVQRLVQGVIAIARELANTPLSKAERVAVEVTEPDPEELTIGITAEMEHTDNPEVARKIALDHLAEDPKYYTKLKAAGLAKIATPFQVDSKTKEKLPAGTIVADKIAVTNENGEKKWKQVQGGLITSQKPGLLGTPKPTSSDSPGT